MHKLRKKTLKKVRSNLRDNVLLLQDQLDNFYYNEQQTLVRLHWTPQQFDDADFFELNKIMSAEKVDSVSDFRAGGSLTDEELAERHTSRSKLREQAGVKSLSEIIAKRKAKLKSSGKEVK